MNEVVRRQVVHVLHFSFSIPVNTAPRRLHPAKICSEQVNATSSP